MTVAGSSTQSVTRTHSGWFLLPLYQPSWQWFWFSWISKSLRSLWTERKTNLWYVKFFSLYLVVNVVIISKCHTEQCKWPYFFHFVQVLGVISPSPCLSFLNLVSFFLIILISVSSSAISQITSSLVFMPNPSLCHIFLPDHISLASSLFHCLSPIWISHA